VDQRAKRSGPPGEWVHHHNNVKSANKKRAGRAGPQNSGVGARRSRPANGLVISPTCTTDSPRRVKTREEKNKAEKGSLRIAQTSEKVIGSREEEAEYEGQKKGKPGHKRSKGRAGKKSLRTLRVEAEKVRETKVIGSTSPAGGGHRKSRYTEI